MGVWTSPRTGNVGDVFTAPWYNAEIRDNLNWVVRPYQIVATEKEIVSSAAEADLLNDEVTITGNTIGAKGGIRCTLIGDHLVHTGVDTRTLTLAIKLGATELYRDTTIQLTDSGNRHVWMLKFWIANRNNTAIQNMGGVFYYSYHGGATTGTGDMSASSGSTDGPFTIPIGGTSAVDTTANQTLKVLATHSVSSSLLSIRREWASIELVGQGA